MVVEALLVGHPALSGLSQVSGHLSMITPACVGTGSAGDVGVGRPTSLLRGVCGPVGRCGARVPRNPVLAAPSAYLAIFDERPSPDGFDGSLAGRGGGGFHAGPGAVEAGPRRCRRRRRDQRCRRGRGEPGSTTPSLDSSRAARAARAPELPPTIWTSTTIVAPQHNRSRNAWCGHVEASRVSVPM